jgi:class 3 adenylate cyclase/CHAT domain-containing protein/tetratricopeptide (TPR) repeat protein
MGKDGDKTRKPHSEKMAKLLQERARLDQILQEKFRKKMAILFTAVCDANRYMATKGDISGQAWLQRHHDIVFAAIENHGGKVENLVGDGVVASFSNILSSARAAVAIQEGLWKNNIETDSPEDEIHVRIGINAGNILQDDNLIAGDVVNVASRIEGLAERDQILISEAVYEEVRGRKDIHCRFHDIKQVKGKRDPLRLYQVFWKDEDIALLSEPKGGEAEKPISGEGKRPQSLFRIEVALEGRHIRICANEQAIGEEETVYQYERLRVPLEKIQSRNQELVEILSSANQKGKIIPEVMTKLKEIGQVLSDELFTKNVKDKVRITSADHLILDLDERLVHIPWELLHDGTEFLCQRFSMGRSVRTRQQIFREKGRLMAKPFDMLILADPLGDLNGASLEGKQMRDFLEGHVDSVTVSLLTGNITSDTVREKIRNYDLVHFAGHADYVQEDPGQSGWRLLDGTMRAEEIKKMAGAARMPALIFSNACQSARAGQLVLRETFQKEIFGLANAFILAGVKHYVGTFWDIMDESSRHFSLCFYKQLLSGVTVGHAIRESRRISLRKYGDASILWASYVLYGDPTFNYMDQSRKNDLSRGAVSSHVHMPSSPTLEPKVRAEKAEVPFSGEEYRGKKHHWLYASLGILALLSTLLWGYLGFLRSDSATYERAVLACYQAGDIEKALKTSKILVEKMPQGGLGYLIQGNIYLRKGNLDEAEERYQSVLKASRSSDSERAQSLVGLGRIASIRKKTDEALNYYRSAILKDPQNVSAYQSQAALLDEKGDYQNALVLFTKAQELAPRDPSFPQLINRIDEKLSLMRDREKKERIDRMVRELLDSKESAVNPLPSDEWTSTPLTLWITDFRVQGYSIKEREEKFITAGMLEYMLRFGRVNLVERAILDRLLEELKLGTSDLVDRTTALALGKLMAAKLILFGQIQYLGSQILVSARLIETETGRIRATLNQSFGNAVPTSVISESLSTTLSKDLGRLYPLRGKISALEGGQIELNIGEEEGVRRGLRFRVIGGDKVLEITAVRPNQSSAKIISGIGSIYKGTCVEAK